VHEAIESRLRGMARRAGWAGAPPAIVAAGLVLACVAVAVAVWRWWPADDSDIASSTSAGLGASAVVAEAATRTSGGGDAAGAAGTAADSSTNTTMCVHVAGAVRQPGVYVLPAGTRVGMAIDVAGGASADGATDALNLAAKLEDGQQVLVPTREQVAQGKVPVCAGPAEASAGAAGGAGSAKVDINTADAAEFDTLPGVGPSTAAKIVADRVQNGPFKSVDDLGRVAGIGPKKLDSLKDLVVVR
jgi:competence protein ComEA